MKDDRWKEKHHMAMQQYSTGTGRFSCRNGDFVIPSLACAEGMARFGHVAYVSNNLLHVYFECPCVASSTAEQPFENI
jgi:hypothetical protein